MAGRTIPWSIGIATGLLLSLTAGTLAQTAASQNSFDRRWQSTVNADVRYFSFSSSNGSPATSTVSGGRGTQLLTTVAGQIAGRVAEEVKVDLLLRTSYVDTKQTANGVTGTFSGMNDTVFSGTVSYLGLAGIQPFISLNVNIPTGTSNAAGNAQRAKSDSDVVQLPAFGEGWNFGPTVGANIPINETTMAALGVGYTNRGVFLREGGSAGQTSRLNPGDVTTLNSSLGYRGERLSLKGSAAYALETVTKIDSLDFFQAGDRIVLTGAAGYAWTEFWSSRVQLTWVHANKNKVILPGISLLMVEAFNSNSDVTRIVVDTTYANDLYSIGPVASYVYRDRNGYDSTTFQFLPAKSSWSAGVAGAYAVSQTAKVTGRAERIWVKEGGSPEKIVDGVLVPDSAVPRALTDAWQFSIAAIVNF